MERITEKQLEAVVLRLNKITGNPEHAWTKTATGIKGNIGNYHLDFAYGYVSLVQMHNEGGGIERILPGGTKRELYEQMQAYLKGLTTAQATGGTKP